jgi:hypothetical protein
LDEVVMRAMARWPDVPAVYGWLSLDRRGRWRLRGEVLTHRKACEFIGRNYACDDAGCWYFQNGPQRVYVQLEYTPWLLRVAEDGVLQTHTGEAVTAPRQAFVDEHGQLLLCFDSGVGLVEDRDLEIVSRGLCHDDGTLMCEDEAEALIDTLTAGRSAPAWLSLGDARVPVTPLRSDQVPSRFRFEPEPGASAARQRND